jgi:hypothetical protein
VFSEAARVGIAILQHVQLTPGKTRILRERVLQAFGICARQIERLEKVADFLK